MREIHYISVAYAQKKEDEFKTSDLIAYVQGIYVLHALRATVGNMFGGKNANFEYPKQAFTLAHQEEELSEDEIERQRQQFIAALQTMESNFKINKEKEKLGE